MAKALAKRRMEGIGEGSLVGTFSRLLQLTSDAVLVFDGAGRVLLANEEAAELLCAGETDVAGLDVRRLFPDLDEAEAPDAEDGLASGEAIAERLPFPVDGSSARASARALDGTLRRVGVRCEAVQAPGETYLLVAHPVDGDVLAGRDFDRTVDDLKRANKRLSGALNIVLDTLDAEDVGELFSRVLDEITATMEADATLVYLAASDGFHLRGAAGRIDVARAPRFMPFGRAIESLALREGRSVRLQVLPARGDALRAGRLTGREVRNDDTREVVKVAAKLLPPFSSFVAVPVWFNGDVIAIIEVGYARQHPLEKEDARLLDSVANYLAVSLAGAFTDMRAQRSRRLDDLLSDLREAVLGMGEQESAHDVIVQVLQDASVALDAAFVELHVGEDGRATATLPLTGEQSLPIAWGPDGACEGAGGKKRASCQVGEAEGLEVHVLAPGTEPCETLRALGEPSEGLLLDGGVLAGERRCCLMLRPDGSEPFDEVELGFLDRLVACLRDVVRGETGRVAEKRISQALQTGMKNELQRVPGITAQGIYSSATAAAFVGGDFYDLINLPDRRACVIMGDVSGKGVEAASVSAAVKTALGAYAWEGLPPARMVRSLNDFLLGFSRVETFATLFVGIVDLARGTISYCSAGHPPALLARAGTGELSILDVQSGVVGAFKDIKYRDGVATIAEGDILLLYTDGTTEARDPSGAFFGEQGLRDMVMRETEAGKPYEGLLDRFLATLEDFTGHTLEDDVAWVSLRFDSLGE